MAIDVLGIRRRYGGGRPGALDEGGALIEKELLLVSSAAELRNRASCTFMANDLVGLSVRKYTCTNIASDRTTASD